MGLYEQTDPDVIVIANAALCTQTLGNKPIKETGVLNIMRSDKYYFRIE